MTEHVKYLDTPDKSETDKKVYKTLLLPNGLRALLISDPTTSKGSTSQSDGNVTGGMLAACAVLMDYGSYSEPKDYPGLAHFLEHMIFMGSEKYPEENIFDKHVQKFGGFTNASTYSDFTVFLFEVGEKHLDSSLDYFTALLKHPLLKQEAMVRERSAVDSEFQEALQDDEERRTQLLGSLATDGYPHGTFSCGNMKSLKENVDDAAMHKTLHDIVREHYVANRMQLCLQACLPMDELETLVLRHFSDVPSNDSKGPYQRIFNYRDAFRPEFHEHAFFVKPVENVCQLDLTWVLPSLSQYYRSKAHSLLLDIIADEGRGSLCAYLRRRLWALKLNVGFDGSSFFGLFNMSISLTDEGFKHIDEVMAATFAYLKVVCQADRQRLREIYDELQVIKATGFRFQRERPPIKNVRELAINMKRFPSKDILTGEELYYEYNEQHVSELIAHLNEFKFNVMITAREYEDLVYDKTEKWFGTEYTSIPMPAKWTKMWQEAEASSIKELFLPEPNRFVATNFTNFWQQDGKPVLPEAPQKVYQNEICELWFRTDDKIGLPEAFMHFYLISPLKRKSAKNDAMCSLYAKLIKFHVSEELYPATNAGLNYRLKVAEKGLILDVNGYTEKLHLLVKSIAQAMVTVGATLNAELLATFVKDQSNSYFNELIKPHDLNKDVRLGVMEHMHWLTIDKYKSLSDITLEDLKQFASQFSQQLYVQGLVQGNYTAIAAHHVMKTLLITLDCRPIQERQYIEDRSLQLPQGSHYIRAHNLNEQDANTVIINYYQIGPNSVRLECILDLLVLIVGEPLFNQLRTQEQLGYQVNAEVDITYGIAAYIVMVNSQETKTTASHVEQRIEVFRNKMLHLVDAMSQEDYDRTCDSLIKLKQITDMSLKSEVLRNWIEIISERYMFDCRRQQIEVLRKLTKQEVLDFLRDNNETSNMRKLSVQIIGHNPETKKASPLADKLDIVFLPQQGDDTTIVDIADFKSNLDQYPMQALRTIPNVDEVLNM